MRTNAYPKRMRLAGQPRFRAVYAERRSVRRGPLVVYVRRNDLPFSRLGVSISRRVGGAVVRNRIRRRLREVFRHLGSVRDRGYDVVINVQRHDVLPVTEYERLLAGAIETLEQRWSKRASNG